MITVRAARTRRWHWIRLIWTGAAVSFLAVAVVTARVFVWPDLQPLPEHSDAIIELGGPGDRDSVALELAREQKAPLLVQSTRRGDTSCLPPVGGVRIMCFYADPNTTRGEARWIGATAAERHWSSVIIVTTPDQAWRARLRVSRCFPGKVYNATVQLPRWKWLRQIPYQWVASIKALVVERTC